MSKQHLQNISTQWTLIWQAAKADSARAGPALEAIVYRYWKPLYLYARQRGWTAVDAEDATQDFLSMLMEGHLLDRVDPAKGRFRFFLLNAWKQFLIDQHRKQMAQRRGGHLRKWSIDRGAAEGSLDSLAAENEDPDHCFTLAWANSVLESARQRLAEDYERRGEQSIFQRLFPYLAAPIDQATYEQLSQQLSISPNALRVALHRLRQRFGETLRLIVSETVDDASEVDEELQELLNALLKRTSER